MRRYGKTAPRAMGAKGGAVQILSRLRYHTIPVFIKRLDTGKIVGVRISRWWLYLGTDALHLYRGPHLHTYVAFRGVRR